MNFIKDKAANIKANFKRKKIQMTTAIKEDFTPKQYEHMHQMFELTESALEQMNFMFSHNKDNIDVNRSFNIEN